MKKIVILLLMFCANIYCQEELKGYEIGCFVDMNYNVIDGYFDFSYAPSEPLTKEFTTERNFTPGCYYDIQGNKHGGLLKYSLFDNYFKFKQSGSKKVQTIFPNDCEGFLVGTDSFTVIQNFDIQYEIGSLYSQEREFAEVMESFYGFTFYKHTSVDISELVVTYMVKFDNSNTIISFPNRDKKFKEIATQVFSMHLLLKKDIENEKYDSDDIPLLITLLKYY